VAFDFALFSTLAGHESTANRQAPRTGPSSNAPRASFLASQRRNATPEATVSVEFHPGEGMIWYNHIIMLEG